MKYFLEEVVFNLIKSGLVKEDQRPIKIIIQAVKNIEDLGYELSEETKGMIRRLDYQLYEIEEEKTIVLNFFKTLRRGDLIKLTEHLKEKSSDNNITLDLDLLKKLFKLD